MKSKIYKGNVEITKNNNKEWQEKLKDVEEITGYLSISGKIDKRTAWNLLKYNSKNKWVLSNLANEFLLAATFKNVSYHINGVNFDKKLFDKVRKDELLAQEVFGLTNIEQRRVAYELMNKQKMKDLGGYKVLDTAVDNQDHTMEIVTFKMEGFNNPFTYLHCSCPSTKREYFVETKKDKCWDAKMGSFGLSEEYQFELEY